MKGRKDGMCRLVYAEAPALAAGLRIRMDLVGATDELTPTLAVGTTIDAVASVEVGAAFDAAAASVEVGVAVEAVLCLCLWVTDVTTWPPFASIDAMIAEAEAWESNTVVAGSSDTVMLGVEECVAVTVTTTVCVTTEGTDVAS